MTKSGQTKVFMMAAAAALILGLTAIFAANPAEAAFPGKNGKVFFQSGRDGNPHIYSMKSDGTGVNRLTFTSANTDPAISPDGTRIAFISGSTTNTSYEVFVMNADGTERRQITNTTVAEQEPSWSPDGTKLIYVSNSFDVDGQTDLEIWTINADGSGRTQLTNNTYSDTQPAWSPLGDKIAFVGTRPGDSDRNVYVMNADGTGEANITPAEPYGDVTYQGNDDHPNWSPDGSQIAYTHTFAANASGVPNVWVMDANGANKVNVQNSSDISGSMPAWSPDSTKIAFVGVASGSTNRDIYAMDANGATQEAPVETGGNAAHDISPDWQQDSIPPNTTITSGPSGTARSTTPSFGFVSSETHSTFECSIDGAPFASCASPKSYSNLKSGTHTFRVRATDIAGNADATPASRAWRIDAIGPVIGSMRPVPGSVIRDRTPTIRATVKDNLTNLVEGNIRLYVNGARISAARYSYNASKDLLVYNSPKLSKRKNTVRIVATDRVGNVGARSWSFLIK